MENQTSESPSIDWRVATIVSAAVGLTALASLRAVIRNNKNRSTASRQQQQQNSNNSSSASQQQQQNAGRSTTLAQSRAAAQQQGTSENAASSTSMRKFVHRGIRCKICDAEPIVGYRYKCATCPQYDVCSQCEADQLDAVHDRTHLFLKIRIPIPPRAIPNHQLLPVFYPGKDAGTSSTLSNSELRTLQTLTHFTREEIENLHIQFKTLSIGGRIDMDTFERCLGPIGQVPNLLTRRLFSMFDQDNDGQIDFQELCCGLSVLLKGDNEEKIRYAFETYDLDSDGYITESELSSVVKAYFYLSQMAVRDAMKQIDQEALDRWNDTAAEPVSKAFAQVAVPGINAQQHSAGPSTTSSSSSSSSSTSSSVNPLSMSQTLPVSEQASHVLLRLDQSLELVPDKAQLLEGAYSHAVEVLVKRAMETADKDRDGRINYAEFRDWALQDRTILSWLDSVGSVF